MKFLLIALISISYQFAYAETTNESESNRNEKMFETLVGIGEYADPISSGLTFNFEGGYYLNSNSLLVFEVAGWGGFSLASAIFGSPTSDTRSITMLSYKYFFGNSFFLRAGVAQVSNRLEVNNYGLFSSSLIATQNVTVSSTDLNLAIGNQWQWQNFTLGCEWLGLEKPVISSVRNDSITGPSASGFDNSNYKREMRNGIAITMLKFMLGASF